MERGQNCTPLGDKIVPYIIRIKERKKIKEIDSLFIPFPFLDKKERKNRIKEKTENI